MSGLMHKVKDAMTGHHSQSSNTSSSNAGPHSSNIANKVDPRVDSDRGKLPIPYFLSILHERILNPLKDNRARHEAMGGAHGPHDSSTANKMDPRVDSDRDNRAHPSGGAGTSGGAYTTGGNYGGSTNAGPHGSNVANKADPRFDSDRDNRARHEALGGAQGPHGSSMANKMDPRVDSDRGTYPFHLNYQE